MCVSMYGCLFVVYLHAVYPSLDLSDNEEETKLRVVEKQDESWNPRGIVVDIRCNCNS